MNGKWITDLNVTDDKPRKWELLTNLVYRDSKEKYYIVPAGFKTDLASIPRPLWSIYPPSTSRKGAVLHDWCYETRPYGVSRKTADRLLYEGCVSEGLPKARAWVLWVGVRAGGWMFW